MSNMEKVIRQELRLGNVFVIDCYEFPTSERRIGIKSFDSILHHSNSHAIVFKEALSQLGYRGKEKSCFVDGTEYQTIPKSDFVKVLVWDAVINNGYASTLLLSVFAEVGLDSISESLFSGDSLDRVESAYEHYQECTALNIENALDSILSTTF